MHYQSSVLCLQMHYQNSFLVMGIFIFKKKQIWEFPVAIFYTIQNN